MNNDNNNTQNEEQTIHEFDINLICEFFSHVERQGPGSPEMTIKGLSFIEELNEQSSIIDIGCGTGGQTMVLAQHTQGSIIGIDLFPHFIELFEENVKKNKLQERVTGMVGNMEALPFEEESIDLIWCEGAIYNIGFQKGINEWKKLLKKGGYLAVTEASWFTNERPEEINSFWNEAYPEIDTISNKVSQMQQAGYVPIATFILPERCWTDHFYTPLIPVREAFLEKHKGNKGVEGFIAYEKYEMELYYKYKDFYGYVFYIGKKM